MAAGRSVCRGGPRRRYRRIAGDGLPDIRPVTPLASCHPAGGCLQRTRSLLSSSLSLSLTLLSLPLYPLIRNFLPLARPKSTVTLHDTTSSPPPRASSPIQRDQLERIRRIHLPTIAFPPLPPPFRVPRHRDGRERVVGIDTVVSNVAGIRVRVTR